MTVSIGVVVTVTVLHAHMRCLTLQKRIADPASWLDKKVEKKQRTDDKSSVEGGGREGPSGEGAADVGAGQGMMVSHIGGGHAQGGNQGAQGTIMGGSAFAQTIAPPPPTTAFPQPCMGVGTAGGGEGVVIGGGLE